jgi:LmbE family N-acetylglucosaminyl deacetylase
MTVIPGKRIVVLSPHLDDAVLSLGASIADAVAGGADVAIVTAFAGDPDRSAEPSVWDRRAGFATSLQALEARREEDRRACAALGAKPVWLPFGYGGAAVDEGELATLLSDALSGADTVLIPGWPLKNPEHAVLALLAFRLGIPAPAIGLYVEQPYVWWRSYVEPGLVPELAAIGVGKPTWTALRASRAGRRAKRRALTAYRSQLRLLRGRTRSLPVRWRISFYERRAGGEGVGWLAASR